MATINAIYSSDPISVGQGGTGVASVKAQNTPICNGSGALNFITPVQGAFLIGSTGADPVWALPTSSASSITVTGSGGTPALNLDLANYQTRTSWTPTLSFGGGSTGITYGTRVGTYARIGQLVIFSFRITLTSKGSSTGTMSIDTLPVAAKTSTNFPCQVRYSVLTFTGQVLGLVAGTSMTVGNAASTGAVATLADTNFANTTTLEATGFYFT